MERSLGFWRYFWFSALLLLFSPVKRESGKNRLNQKLKRKSSGRRHQDTPQKTITYMSLIMYVK